MNDDRDQCGAIPERTFDIQEAAKLLGLNPESIRVMIRQGRITGAVKMGRDWRIPSGVMADICAHGIPGTRGAV